ncbi:hypothetical protein ACWEO1_27185 [Kitasatospora cineracea]
MGRRSGRADLELSGIPADAVRKELGYGWREFERILGVTGVTGVTGAAGAAPASVRRLRDHPEGLVREAGRAPVPRTACSPSGPGLRPGAGSRCRSGPRSGADRPSADAS